MVKSGATLSRTCDMFGSNYSSVKMESLKQHQVLDDFDRNHLMMIALKVNYDLFLFALLVYLYNKLFLHLCRCRGTHFIQPYLFHPKRVRRKVKSPKQYLVNLSQRY